MEKHLRQLSLYCIDIKATTRDDDNVDDGGGGDDYLCCRSVLGGACGLTGFSAVI